MSTCEHIFHTKGTKDVFQDLPKCSKGLTSVVLEGVQRPCWVQLTYVIPMCWRVAIMHDGSIWLSVDRSKYIHSKIILINPAMKCVINRPVSGFLNDADRYCYSTKQLNSDKNVYSQRGIYWCMQTVGSFRSSGAKYWCCRRYITLLVR